MPILSQTPANGSQYDVSTVESWKALSRRHTFHCDTKTTRTGVRSGSIATLSNLSNDPLMMRNAALNAQCRSQCACWLKSLNAVTPFFQTLRRAGIAVRGMRTGTKVSSSGFTAAQMFAAHRLRQCISRTNTNGG